MIHHQFIYSPSRYPFTYYNHLFIYHLATYFVYLFSIISMSPYYLSTISLLVDLSTYVPSIRIISLAFHLLPIYPFVYSVLQSPGAVGGKHLLSRQMPLGSRKRMSTVAMPQEVEKKGNQASLVDSVLQTSTQTLSTLFHRVKEAGAFMAQMDTESINIKPVSTAICHSSGPSPKLVARISESRA